MSQQEEFKKKMWDVVTPHIYGSQAPKAPSKAISIYDIEKEKQKVRDLENANAQGEAYGSARLSAPVYQPQISEVPIIENADEILTQQPKQEVKEEAKIEQPKSFYSQFLDMTKAPITADEQARRDRASRAVQATGALGNLMSAFANLTFTGKGAPSQSLPTQAVDKIGGEMTTWQDKLRSEREKYAAAGLAAIAKDYEIAYRAAKDKEDREDRLAQREIDNTIRLGNLEISKAKLANDAEYQRRMLDLRAKDLIQNGVKADNAFKQAMKELSLKEDQLKLGRDELNARVNGTYYSGSTKGAKGITPKVVDTIGGQMQINEDAYTPEVMSQALSSIGYTTDGMSETSMRSAIGAILGNYSDADTSKAENKGAAALRENLMKAGVLKGEDSKKVNLNLSSLFGDKLAEKDSVKTDW